MQLSPVTIARDVLPIGMSYWNRINNHKNLTFMTIALGTGDSRIRLLQVDKGSLKIIGELNVDFKTTTEDMYWSKINPNLLYVRSDSALTRVNVLSSHKEIIMAPEHYKIWQCHSSYNDLVHSCSLRDGQYNTIGWGIQYGTHPGDFRIYVLRGEPDECQIDKSGQFLTAKEKIDGNDGLRIINLRNNQERIITDEEGAPQHSDCGFRCILGEDDQNSEPGALVSFDLDDAESKRLIYSTGVWNMGYFSFCNATNIPLQRQKGLLSTTTELISVKLSEKKKGRVLHTYKETNVYEDRVKANLCPLGQYAIWTEREDEEMVAKVIKIPAW